MAKPQRKKKAWYKLDNAAMMYSAIQRENYSAIYRFSAVMDQPVDRQALQRDQGAVLPAPPDPAAALPVLAASLERMYPLVEPLGVPRPVLRARFMTSRWGSCHVAKGVVVLNTALAAAEEDLLDYVTLHELVHFLHPNHGAGFYAAMDALLPDWQVKRRRLKGRRLERP